VVNRIRNVLARFPEAEEVVRRLIRENRDFDALCQEYEDTNRELEELAKLADPAAAIQAEGLRKRRMIVEEELLTVIEGYV
jgi:hypothetical protein